MVRVISETYIRGSGKRYRVFYPIKADSKVPSYIEIYNKVVCCFKIIVCVVYKRASKDLVSEGSIGPSLNRREKGGSILLLIQIN